MEIKRGVGGVDRHFEDAALAGLGATVDLHIQFFGIEVDGRTGLNFGFLIVLVDDAVVFVAERATRDRIDGLAFAVEGDFFGDGYDHERAREELRPAPFAGD